MITRTISKPFITGATEKKGRPEWMTDGRLSGHESPFSPTCKVLNNLPRLWFSGVSQKCRNSYLLHRCLKACRTVIERIAHDFQFRVLIVHRGFYVAVPHRSHYGRKVAGSHQHSRTIVVSRTVEPIPSRKARFVARFSEEIAN